MLDRNACEKKELYKEDLSLNNLQWLICHKTQQTNQTNNKPTKQGM